MTIAAEPAAWREAGFEVSADICEVGEARLRLGGADAGRGVVSWAVRGLGGADLDGLPTVASDGPRAAGRPHPNGVLSIDHLVVGTPHLERTVAALRRAGLDLRRLREGPTPGGSERQAFFRMGEVLLEVIEAPEGSRTRADRHAPARFWGIAFLVHDLDSPARALRDHLGEARDAVQPGRRIATVSRAAGLGTAVAFITPGAGAA